MPTQLLFSYVCTQECAVAHMMKIFIYIYLVFIYVLSFFLNISMNYVAEFIV